MQSTRNLRFMGNLLIALQIGWYQAGAATAQEEQGGVEKEFRQMEKMIEEVKQSAEGLSSRLRSITDDIDIIKELRFNS
jgi:hypothetical protein